MDEVDNVYNEIFASLPNQRKIEYFQSQNFDMHYIDKLKNKK